jgi:hypothetical protein
MRPGYVARRWAIIGVCMTVLHGSAVAQGRLVGYGTVTGTAVFERWDFGDGISQPVRGGDGTVVVDHASQFSLPLMAKVPLGQRWTFDVAAAYTIGRVVLATPDPDLNVSRYELDGLTDARIRATGRLNPTVSVTLGLNLPTGHTSLDSAETEAFRVLAAPPLSFQTARLGRGFAATAGVVLSRQLGPSWAGALGASYELRGKYEPGAIIPALSSSDFSPSDALRFSAGLDGLVGEHGLTVGLSLDVFPNSDEITDPTLGDGLLTSQLGPIVTADAQLRIASRQLRELTVYAVDRYRTRYKIGSSAIGNSPVPESSGNYLDLGVRALIPAGRRSGILVVPNFRHQTGLKADNTLATAGIVSGGLTVGLIREIGTAYLLQPFVRGQVGRLKSGTSAATATALAGGVTLGMRF